MNRRWSSSFIEEVEYIYPRSIALSVQLAISALNSIRVIMSTPARRQQAFSPSSTNSPRGQTPIAPLPSSSLPHSRSGCHGKSCPPNNHSGNPKAFKSPHTLAPVNATNPALIPIYNCLILLCCLLPGPEGRGVQVGLCPRVSTGHARQRRTKERAEMKRCEEILERKSSSTGLSSSRGKSPMVASTTAGGSGISSSSSENSQEP